MQQNQQQTIQKPISQPSIPKPSSQPAIQKPSSQPSIQKPTQSQPQNIQKPVSQPSTIAKPSSKPTYVEESTDDYDEDQSDEEEEEEEEDNYSDCEVGTGDFPFKDEPLQGIFYYISQVVGSPVRYGLVSMDGGGSRQRTLKYLIDMNDNDRWWCNKKEKETRWEDAWFTLKFLKHTVKLTHYTLFCKIGYPFCAQPKSWKLYARNRGREWTLLDEQKNVKGMNQKNAKMT